MACPRRRRLNLTSPGESQRGQVRVRFESSGDLAADVEYVLEFGVGSA